MRGFSLSNRKAIVSTYCANVRSVLEYCSVIWGGAAKVHLKRIERVQHKFLLWLCSRCRVTNVSFEYAELLRYFGMNTLAARRVQHDLMFMRNIQNQSVDSSFLLGCFPLAAPTRTLRAQVLFHVPHGRVNTVLSGMFCRLPRSCNTFLDRCRNVDVWALRVCQYKKSVIAYVKSLTV